MVGCFSICGRCLAVFSTTWETDGGASKAPAVCLGHRCDNRGFFVFGGVASKPSDRRKIARMGMYSRSQADHMRWRLNASELEAFQCPLNARQCVEHVPHPICHQVVVESQDSSARVDGHHVTRRPAA